MTCSVLKSTDRAELYKILGFLNEFIPYSCEVHSIVLAALQTRNPCYSIYYLLNNNDDTISSGASDKTYLAIVGVKKEHALDPKTNNRSVAWMLAPWFKDVNSLIEVYRSINEGINWSRDSFFLFNNGHEPPAEVLQFLKNDCKVKEERLTNCPVNRYNTTFTEALNLEMKIPEEVYIKSLERQDAGIIYDTWAFKHSSTVEDLEDEIEQLPSAGVYLKETDELICWINFHLAFGMARLFTLEAHRRKGYATLAIQYGAKRTAQAGYVPVLAAMTYLPLNNEFFGKLPGFKFLKAAHGLYISPSQE